MPVKSILDGSVQKNCCTKPLIDVLRSIEQFFVSSVNLRYRVELLEQCEELNVGV